MPQGTSDCFRYKSLQGVGAIRLLALQPSTEQQEPLSGALVHTTLDECREDLIGGYTALSYVWGLPDKTHSICLGQDEVKITASLDAGLRALRDRARVHLIWADALCINQDDIPERNVQVSMMGQIYWTARNTVIYLGEETEATAIILTAAQRRHTLDEQAVGTVSRLHDEIAEDYIDFNFQQDEQDEQDEKVGGPDSPVSFVEPSKATDAFGAEHELSKVLRQAAQMDLLRRPWFHRVWIYQELVLSRQPWVQCGQQRVWWSDLCNLLLPVIGDSFGDSFVKDMDDVRCSFHSSGQRKLGITGWDLRDLWEGNRPLWEILHSRRGSQATDPRDMVFGFMSLHSDRDRVMRRISIDYSRSLEDVFLSAAKYVLESVASPHKALDVLTQSITSSRVRERLPSWVPDWGVQIPDYSPFFKQKPSTPHEPLSTADKVLVFAPLGYRTIKDISAVLPHRSEYPPDFLAELKRWRKVDENARASLREHQGWDPLKKSGMWKLPKFIEDIKQWRNVMRKVWKGFVQPLKPHDEQAFVYEQLMHSMDLGHLYWLVDRYFPREEDENQSSLEEDCPGRQFRLYRGEDDNLSFITADARPRDLLVDACSFRPPKGSITGIHGEGLVQTIKCANFLDRGMGSSKERFATHNQRTFFLDRGGTLIIRPSPQSADDNLDHAIRRDFIDEVKLRNGADIATPDPESWNIHLCHFILVGRHDEHDEEPLYRCWWDSGMDAWYDKGGKPVKATQAEGFASATDGMPWPEPLASTVDEYWEDAKLPSGWLSRERQGRSHKDGGGIDVPGSELYDPLHFRLFVIH